jgi:hypothetical protein
VSHGWIILKRMYQEDLWAQSVRWLEGELPDKDINTWLRPLHAVPGEGRLLLLAPNRLVLERALQPPWWSSVSALQPNHVSTDWSAARRW